MLMNILSLFQSVVQAGACLHTQDKTLKTPLMCAAEYGHLAILKMLTTAGARLDDRVGCCCGNLQFLFCAHVCMYVLFDALVHLGWGGVRGDEEW